MHGQYVASPARNRRRFLTQRDFQEMKAPAQCPSEGGPLPSSPGGHMREKGANPAPFLPICPRKVQDIPETGLNDEVETHISDGSELPSSASAVAAMQLEQSGSSTFISEIQRLQQENLALRSENAELKRKPQSPEDAAGSGQSLRFGAPLRYVIVSPAGRDPGNFDFSFSASDVAELRRCRSS
eukprot:gnl/MRDRNA2_/MRDRNA2_87946_c0_seq1.p1 gnl/MRDRNA2_/MRDRNA2_87946_c0~~gnl/MRDRNA2_/MRDRNA2_87946_c0_seq1.p1  ORF type:complete len:184 (+),score=33.76 gnl/MRDRNA2_/MRDRNA2_87946_c0_seq1:112-663(+)